MFERGAIHVVRDKQVRRAEEDLETRDVVASTEIPSGRRDLQRQSSARPPLATTALSAALVEPSNACLSPIYRWLFFPATPRTRSTMKRRTSARDGKRSISSVSSGKKRREQLSATKAAKRAKRDEMKRAARLGVAGQHLAVDISRLAPHNSYSQPQFVERGYYVDQRFECVDCGVPQVWTEAQQKWWYEVAKGYPFTTAIRCRACRRSERARREQARRGTPGGRDT